MGDWLAFWENAARSWPSWQRMIVDVTMLLFLLAPLLYFELVPTSNRLHSWAAVGLGVVTFSTVVFVFVSRFIGVYRVDPDALLAKQNILLLAGPAVAIPVTVISLRQALESIREGGQAGPGNPGG